MDSTVIENLISKANNCIKSYDSGVEFFLENVGSYLTQLEEWRKKVTQEEVANSSEQVKARIKYLLELHQQISEKSNSIKTEVAKDIGDLSKKANVLKAYLDHAPGRVTITGSRKG